MFVLQSKQVKIVAVLLLSGGVLWYSVQKANDALVETRGVAEDRSAAAEQMMRTAQAFEVQSFEGLLGLSDLEDSNQEILSEQVIDHVQNLFQQAPVYNFSQTSEESFGAITRLAAAFVYYRFLQHDPRGYIDWRLSLGDQFRDSETLYARWQIALDYPDLIGQPFPENPRVRDVFVEFMNVQQSLWGDTHTPVGLAIHPDSMLVSTAYYDPVVGEDTALFDDEWLVQYWIKPQAGVHRNWFTSETDEFLSAHPLTQYEIGTVGMTFAFANGDRRTLTLGFRRTSANAQWHIGSLSVANPSSEGGLIEY